MTVPAIRALRANAERFSAVAPHDWVEVEVEVSETLAAPGKLELLVGARVASCEVAAGGYLCTYPVEGDEPKGSTSIKATATDAAGNAGSQSLSVSFDFTAPTLVSSRASPALAKLGDDLTYSVTASETLSAAPA